MKIKFLAKGTAPNSYDISGRIINGIDVSLFPARATFTGNEETQAAGIYGMQWVDGVLHVSLGQMTKAYQFPVYSHDWEEGNWIDATDYDRSKCYVKATNPQAVALLDGDQAEYFRDNDGKWSVRMTETEEQEPVV
ncbi:hypothetical protein [Vreelandella populi]|uniref:Uncharacterized protein n=1 Tax=Vreelandella populi TaxID=2498858 RepID=A0A3S0YKI0_9GAMM|nr:hypothetical protein [Halomonas populi]RUR43382.1 hypothetical protein ELY37_16830 [Halomonas populi]